MADEAHKEPTMEEILSSIRKIISEDEAPLEEAPAPSPEVEDIAVASAVNDDFEDVVSEDEAGLSFDDDFEEEDIFEADTDFEDEIDLNEEPEFEPEEAFSAADAPEAAVVETIAEPEPAPVIEPEPAPEPAPAPVAAAPTPPPARQETAVTQPASIQTSALTDDSTADAAAGALGKLISNMDLGGENTIEALVRELLKPMIKEWLDTNLQGIVEAKVEAEVARIARMAR